jgi:hypothetical protein
MFLIFLAGLIAAIVGFFLNGMARRKKKRLLDLSMNSQHNLTLQKTLIYLYLYPLGGLGPIDIVTLNMTTGKYTAYDVKSKNYRKKESYIAPDGYKRNLKGNFYIKRCYKRTKETKGKKLFMQLSKHFKLEEMTKSMTATRKGIDNTPGAGDIKNLENVCYEILEPVRAKFDKPVYHNFWLQIRSIVRSNRLKEKLRSTLKVRQ